METAGVPNREPLSRFCSSFGQNTGLDTALMETLGPCSRRSRLNYFRLRSLDQRWRRRIKREIRECDSGRHVLSLALEHLEETMLRHSNRCLTSITTLSYLVRCEH
jgi:hypothetical protein